MSGARILLWGISLRILLHFGDGDGDSGGVRAAVVVVRLHRQRVGRRGPVIQGTRHGDGAGAAVDGELAIAVAGLDGVGDAVAVGVGRRDAAHCSACRSVLGYGEAVGGTAEGRGPIGLGHREGDLQRSDLVVCQASLGVCGSRYGVAARGKGFPVQRVSAAVPVQRVGGDVLRPSCQASLAVVCVVARRRRLVSPARSGPRRPPG